MCTHFLAAQMQVYLGSMVVWGPHPGLRGAPHTLAWEPQPRDKQYQLTFMGNYSSSAKALYRLLCPGDLT